MTATMSRCSVLARQCDPEYRQAGSYRTARPQSDGTNLALIAKPLAVFESWHSGTHGVLHGVHFEERRRVDCHVSCRGCKAPQLRQLHTGLPHPVQLYSMTSPSRASQDRSPAEQRWGPSPPLPRRPPRRPTLYAQKCPHAAQRRVHRVQKTQEKADTFRGPRSSCEHAAFCPRPASRTLLCAVRALEAHVPRLCPVAVALRQWLHLLRIKPQVLDCRRPTHPVLPRCRTTPTQGRTRF
ncbi:hypothetical protein C8Q76DRAFT_424875 [Earliella scabrosa]|nr:hypothetical protein C8Q76DRAFT_424875 [Earliella scabrosa]